MVGVVENPSRRIREDRGSLDERYAVFPYIRARFATVPFKGRSQATVRIARIHTIRPALFVALADTALFVTAGDVQDMNQPTFRLHSLKGIRKGVWAVTVRANWRVTFRFEGGDAYDVDLEDYH
jgi:toxin HigB-1